MSAHQVDSVGMRLFWEVVRRGWTLSDAAERSGVPAERLSELFWNLRAPEPQELESLAEALVAQTANVVERASTARPERPSETMLAQMTAMLDAMSRKSGNGE